MKSRLFPWLRILLVAAAFGLAALAIVEAGLTIPIPGSGVVTDPREIFTTIGAGFTGPLGGIVIGLLAGFREPGGIVIASLLAHVAGGLWMGLAYHNNETCKDKIYVFWPNIHSSESGPGRALSARSSG